MSQANEQREPEPAPQEPEPPAAKPEVPKPQVGMGARGIELHSIEELHRFATMIYRSGVAAKNLGTNKAPATVEDICVAVAFGLELGMGPMQAAAGVLKIRDRLTLGGDTARALVEAHPTCEYIRDNAAELAQVKEWTPEVESIVSLKRTNRPEEITRRWSVRDAMTAGLWNQDGPWKTYKPRMMYYRPLGFVLRDGAGDILKGLVIAEELRDYPANGLQSGSTLDGADLDQLTDKMTEPPTGRDDE